jgi:hypothetical protein
MDRGFRETSRSRCFAAFSQGPTSADTSRQTGMGLGLATRRSRHAGQHCAPGGAVSPPRQPPRSRGAARSPPAPAGTGSGRAKRHFEGDGGVDGRGSRRSAPASGV